MSATEAGRRCSRIRKVPEGWVWGDLYPPPYSRGTSETVTLNFPLENRSFRIATLLAALACLLLVPFLFAAQTSSAKAPACTEYCYEPIPVPGTEPTPTDQAPEEGSPVETGDTGGEQVATEQPSEVEDALGVLASKSGGDGGSGGGTETGRSDQGQSASGALAPQGSSDEQGTNGLWIILLVVLGGATVALFGLGLKRFREGGLSTPDVLIRAFAVLVGLGLIFLLSPGVSGASAASAPRSFFGMMSIEQISEADADRMSSGGVSTYRFPMSWDSVQQGPAAPYDWASIDQTVSASSKAGLRLLPIMSGTPKGFASKYTTLPINTSSQQEGWAAFLRAAIARYGPSGEFWRENPDVPKKPVRTWQIWNEANFFYFTEPVVPGNYLKLLKASHKVIKREDPGAKVMLSGLYGSPPNEPRRAMKSWQFLDKLYDLGAKGYFDSVAIHPYTPDTQQLKLLLEKVRKTLDQNGAKGTPIDVTEIGWGSDRKTAFGKGSTRAQAQQLTSGLNFLIGNRRKLGIRSAYWFAWKDMPRDAETCNFCYSSGLFYSGSGLRPKPAWDAFVKITGGARS